jgi:hypothetical protein
MPPPVAAPIPHTGPFGFWYGMTKEQAIALTGKDSIKGVKDDSIEFTKAPKSHPAFESYTLIFSPTQGLLKIIAYGNDISTTVFGSEVRSKFEDMKEALTATYGRPQVIDHLPSGSIWKEPEDWMMGLLKKERTLAADWTTDKYNLMGIVLEAKALSREKAFLILVYEFQGWNQYVDAKAAKANTVL